MNSKNPLSPFYTVEIRTPAQARLWRKVLIAKIIVQVIILIGLLALAGWSLQTIGLALLFAAVWKGFDIWRKNRRPTASASA